jgi:hypothetical protein
MLSTYSQYSPQGLMPQFLPGVLLGAPGGFAQPGAYAGNIPFGYDSRYSGAAQHPFAAYPFAAQPMLTSQLSQFPFATSPFAGQGSVNPYLQSPSAPSMYGVPNVLTGGHANPWQISSLVAQLAQQICVQGAIAQQTGIALYQLVQQLIQQVVHQAGQTHPGIGLDGGHAFGSPFAPSGPFSPTAQSGYGGFVPQVGSPWGATRPTIQ